MFNHFNINNQYNNLYFLWLLLENDTLSIKKIFINNCFCIESNIKVILLITDKIVKNNN